MNQQKKRILKLIETDEVKDVEEKERLMFIVTNKRFNPYSIRHSAITANSDYFPEYALKKMVKCSMNSKQGTRYTKKRMGNELKILEHDSIISEKEIIRKSCIQSCPRRNIVNAFENKYCSRMYVTPIPMRLRLELFQQYYNIYSN